LNDDFSSKLDPRSNETYLLEPGFIYFNQGFALVQAVLGNCVSVCLWDKKLHIGGMNNFLYPHTNKKSEATAKYGNVATAALIRMMEEAGSERRNMLAQVFGGGHPEGEEWADVRELAEKNISAARRILAGKKIKIASEDVGGHMGRKVIFDVSTGRAAVIKVQEIRKDDWHHWPC